MLLALGQDRAHFAGEAEVLDRCFDNPGVDLDRRVVVGQASDVVQQRRLFQSADFRRLRTETFGQRLA